MPFTIIQDDITRVKTDAIVNAANAALAPGGGVCGAIFAAAGYQDLDRACRQLGGCPTGQAVLTPGFRLPARHIIHTVGPVWQGGGRREPDLLRSCYETSLALAKEAGCRSVAFPLISAGIYGYPKDRALAIARETILAFLAENDMDVVLVLFDRSVLQLGRTLYGNIRRYIDDTYEAAHVFPREPWEPDLAAAAAPGPSPMGDGYSLAQAVAHLDDTFSQQMLAHIDRKGLTDTQVYKRANMDRKLFSKLRGVDYQPSKRTALALCIALELNLDETRDLLAKAGYALSHSSRQDVIVEYFIQAGEYDIFAVNEALFTFGEKTL